ncbi:hypothetical protein D9613_006536 [Agrocybe pediades]|uniref:Uncharacterized protein n=1 Tax=Agrocybe pediades TaxID=84607 RepID=A0A8H4VKE8_9AGAR|nr:hypothetical protein D9613_006536 [Agrocybe pediades]
MFILPTNAPHLSQLRSLEIGPVCDPTDLIQTLSSTSLLEKLKIELDRRHINCDSDSEKKPNRVSGVVPSKKVTLPCLKKLVVKAYHDTLGAAVTILDSLDMTTDFTLFFESTTNGEFRSQDVDGLARILTVYLSSRQAHLPNDEGAIELESRHCFHVKYEAIGLFVFIPEGLTAGCMLSLLRSLLGAPCFQRAQSLELDSLHCEDPVHDGVREILASLTSVASLVIDEDDLSDIVRWSGEANDGGAGELLPALEEMFIEGKYSNGLAHEVLLNQFAENRIARRGKPLKAEYWCRVLKDYVKWQFDSQA